jgi:hypothetical protein
MKAACQESAKGRQKDIGMQWAHEKIHRLVGRGLLDEALGRKAPPVANNSLRCEEPHAIY